VKNLAVGRINNVDIRYNVMVNSRHVDIAAASNSTCKSISIFAINKAMDLPSHISKIKTDLADPYGFF
jgi:3-phytase